MSDRVVIVCSCEKTMPLDEAAIGKACGGKLRAADQLCRRELDQFKSVVATGAPITVGCTQEAPLFAEIATEMGAEGRVLYANIRENAGWSSDAQAAAPKMAALLAAAAEPVLSTPLVAMESRGVALVYGRDDVAIEAGRRLADHLDVTVLLTHPGEIAPPLTSDLPVLQGTVAGAKGHLGAFELRIDDYAIPAPSSRRTLVFGPSRDGATSNCDLVIDLAGGVPMFSAHELRSGYLRADPRDPVAVERALLAASHLVGEFDKPRFIDFHASLCVHSRSRITGCTRCLDVCPTGAIVPVGDHVAIDPYVCAGCGSCAAVCPTGAASYALPLADALIRRLRALVLTYRAAGGTDAVALFHDGDHGEPLIAALARFGKGVPANVIPVRVNEVSQIGPETIAALFAYGAVGARLLTRGKAKPDIAPTRRVVELGNKVLQALGYGSGVVSIIETDDPDQLRTALDRAPLGRPSPQPASFLVNGPKRQVLEFAFRELHRVAPAPVDVVPLDAGAPFGGLDFDVNSCTLCLACVGVCPTNALSDHAERPRLAFAESLCVQCGLCAATCPEDVITLRPELDFTTWNAPRRIVKDEEPFHCITCAKPFGTRSSIERVISKLQDRHWMFSGSRGEARVRVLMMCEDCRVEVVMGEDFDPHATERPVPRTI